MNTDQIANLLRARVQKTVVVALDADPKLLRLLSVWHLVSFQTVDSKPPKGRLSQSASTQTLVQALWAGKTVDHDHAKALLGRNFPVSMVFEQAKALLVVYPDGSIHDFAADYLRMAAADVLTGFASVREQRKRAETNRAGGAA